METQPPSPTNLAIGVRRPLREEVRETLLNAILTGEFAPGARIVESQVARQLGVSQATVREALRELEMLGLTISQHHRGVVVRPLTRRGVVEMYEMRALLEGHAARLAIAHVTDASVAALDALVDRMLEVAPAGSLAELIRLDVEFHQSICRMAEHGLLERLWAAVHPHLWTYVAARGLLDLDSAIIAERHRPIVAALRSRDADAAVAAMRRHLLELRDLARARFDEAASANGGSQSHDPAAGNGRDADDLPPRL
jgi:DNA-binding GntR family transcriptional regulator